jgi:hypothetical protein
LFSLQNINNVNKGTHFIGQPMYGQLIFLLDKAKILKFSRENGGETDFQRHALVGVDLDAALLLSRLRMSPHTLEDDVGKERDCGGKKGQKTLS